MASRAVLRRPRAGGPTAAADRHRAGWGDEPAGSAVAGHEPVRPPPGRDVRIARHGNG